MPPHESAESRGPDCSSRPDPDRRDRRPGDRWFFRRLLGLALAASTSLIPGLHPPLGGPAAAASPRSQRARQPSSRAKPPATIDKGTATAFFDDAFSTLEDERPDFAAIGRPQVVTAAGTGAGAGSAGGTNANAQGFAWSRLIGGDALVDEIKEQKAAVATAVASVSDFKGGGYDEARVAYGSIALCFGVIAAYDGDVRWKNDAETARDLFARVGANCKVGTQQSFDESKARLADLESLLDGSGIETRTDREEDFRWNMVAGRPALMTRLEAADERTAAATSSKDDFSRQVEAFLHEVEIVAAIGEVIQRPDYEYHDDETYRGHATRMRDAAVRAREAAGKNDYDAARTAVGELKKSCDACHGEYRS